MYINLKLQMIFVGLNEISEMTEFFYDQSWTLLVGKLN